MANKIPVYQADREFLIKNESVKMYPTSINNVGTLPWVSGGNNSSALAWKTASLPTISANTAVTMTSIFTPLCGRKYVINGKIEIETTSDCIIIAQVEATSISTDSNSIPLANVFQHFSTSQPSATGGIATIDFSKNPLIVKDGEKLVFFYCKNSTTGVNWEIRIQNGLEMTSDDDYEAPYSIGYFGDSIMRTSETKSQQYIKKEDGTIIGQTPFILKAKFQELKKNSRVVNMSIGGTNAYQWSDWFSRGKYDIIKTDIGIVTLGMNDCESNYGLSTAVGVDGFFKSALKNIIRKFFLINPNSKLVLNTITATDSTNKVATILGVTVGVAGYPYNGIVRRTAYNTEISQVVTEMNALGFTKVYLSDVANSYTTSEAAFIDSPKVHANNTLGHPRIAEKIWLIISNFL